MVTKGMKTERGRGVKQRHGRGKEAKSRYV
jgi:hypothetical protein